MPKQVNIPTLGDLRNRNANGSNKLNKGRIFRFFTGTLFCLFLVYSVNNGWFYLPNFNALGGLAGFIVIAIGLVVVLWIARRWPTVAVIIAIMATIVAASVMPSLKAAFSTYTAWEYAKLAILLAMIVLFMLWLTKPSAKTAAVLVDPNATAPAQQTPPPAASNATQAIPAQPGGSAPTQSPANNTATTNANTTP